MGNVKDLIVRILVDDKEVDNFQKAGDKAAGFGNVMNKAAGVSLAALGGLATGAVFLGKAASDLEQSAGGVDAVFGRYAKSMHDNANAAALAVGLSANSYNEFATVIGAQLKNAGTPMDELGGKTSDLIGKAADLAATFGGPTSDAVDAISAAMRGEMDPVEKYGITLNQASLQQKALSMGITSSASTWDTATKQQVVLAAITEKGSVAWGQYAKQSGTAAEKQGQAAAAFETAAGQIGTTLLPVMAKGAGLLADFGGWAQRNAGLVQGLAIGVGVLASAVLLASGVMRAYALVQAIQTAITAAQGEATGKATIGQWLLNAAMTANPIGIIVVAIAALVAGLIWFFTQTDLGKEIWANFASFFVTVGNSIASWWNGLWSGIASFFSNAWDGVFNFGRDALLAYGKWLIGIGTGISSWWNGLWTGIGSFFGTIWNGLQGIVKGAWNGILGFIENGVNGAIALINGIIRGINGVGGAIGVHLNVIPNVSLPRLAAGGITTGPTVAMIGDNPGGRELVLPLNSPAARDLLGGSNEPIRIHPDSVDAIAQATARYTRNENRKGLAA